MERNIQRGFIKKLSKIGFARKISAENYAGMPDVLFVLSGCVYFLELKTLEGKVSKVQQHTIDMINYCGGDARILRGSGEMEAFINEITN